MQEGEAACCRLRRKCSGCCRRRDGAILHLAAASLVAAAASRGGQQVRITHECSNNPGRLTPCYGEGPHTWVGTNRDVWCRARDHRDMSCRRLTCTQCTCNRKPSQPRAPAAGTKFVTGRAEDRQREDHAAAAERRAKVLAAERQAELTAEIGRILDADSPHEVFEVGAATLLHLRDASSCGMLMVRQCLTECTVTAELPSRR